MAGAGAAAGAGAGAGAFLTAITIVMYRYSSEIKNTSFQSHCSKKTRVVCGRHRFKVLTQLKNAKTFVK